jgi:hypothetical protein
MQPRIALPQLAAASFAYFGVLCADSAPAQTFYPGPETTVTLAPGTYDILAYGAQGGAGVWTGGLGAEAAGIFTFQNFTTLSLLVGGMGNSGVNSGGGGGGSFVVEGTMPLAVAGGGGGSGSYSSGVGAGSVSGSGDGGNCPFFSGYFSGNPVAYYGGGGGVV